MQQALEVIEGSDGLVTQHLIEFLGNGVPLPGRYQGVLSELAGVALSPVTDFLYGNFLWAPSGWGRQDLG